MTNSPCPFCGTNPPDLRVDVEEDAGKYAAEAHCLDCDAVGPETGWYDDRTLATKQAIVLWNRREGAHCEKFEKAAIGGPSLPGVHSD